MTSGSAILRSGLFATLLMALPIGSGQAIAQQACTAQSNGQVIVQDFSGSMRGRDGMAGTPPETRVEAARQVTVEITDQYSRLASSPPTGLVLFGHLYRPGRTHCQEAVTLAVPVPTESGSNNALAKIADLVRTTKPIGRTPLFDALVMGAEALRPGGGGRIVVVTDFDEERCGPDPCDIVQKLDDIGLPLGKKITIGYVVAIGLNGLHQQNVERFARCTGAKPLAVTDLATAGAAAREIACGTPPETTPPPANPLLESVQPEPPPGATAAISIRFSSPVVLPTWTFEEINAKAEVVDPHGNRSKPVPLRSRPVDVEISTQYPDIFVTGDLGLQTRQTVGGVTPGSHRDVPIIVDPCTLTLEIPGLAAHGGDSNDMSWEIESDRGLRAGGALSGAASDILLPPGAYRVRVNGIGGPPQDVTLRYAPQCGGVVRFASPAPPASVPRLGTLQVTTRVADPTLFASPQPPPEVSARNSTGQVDKITAARTDLKGGDYTVSYGAVGRPSVDLPGIRIESGLTTSVMIIDSPGRLRIEAQHLEPFTAGIDAVEWTIRPIHSGVSEAKLHGPVLDQIVPAGRYEITATLAGHPRKSMQVLVEDGRIMSGTLIVD